MKFKTTLLQSESKNVMDIVVPPEIIANIGGGKRPPVKVTFSCYSYRNTVGVMLGKFMVGVPSEHRVKANVKGGDAIDVEIELDSTSREVVTPTDFATTLKKAKFEKLFDGLAYSHRREHVCLIEDAKSPDTRIRRNERTIQKIVVSNG